MELSPAFSFVDGWFIIKFDKVLESKRMDPSENGYLAHHFQNQFYYNFYNPSFFPEFSYNYGSSQLPL
jgi:hypothetical protein